MTFMTDDESGYFGVTA